MMMDEVYQGQGVLAQGPIMPGNWAYYSEQTTYRYDPDGARQLLAGMGLTLAENGRFISDGALIELTLLTPDDAQHLALAEILRQNWEKIGIGVSISALPYDQVIANLQSRNYQMAWSILTFQIRPIRIHTSFGLNLRLTQDKISPNGQIQLPAVTWNKPARRQISKCVPVYTEISSTFRRRSAFLPFFTQFIITQSKTPSRILVLVRHTTRQTALMKCISGIILTGVE
jgi:hypothetical protein